MKASEAFKISKDNGFKGFSKRSTNEKLETIYKNITKAAQKGKAHILYVNRISEEMFHELIGNGYKLELREQYSHSKWYEDEIFKDFLGDDSISSSRISWEV